MILQETDCLNIITVINSAVQTCSMYFGSDIWLSQPQCVSIWKCLLWREACLHGKNIQVSWQSTVKIFYCIQQPSLTRFCILPVSQLRRLSICHTLRNEPITYLLLLFVGASMTMTLQISPLHNLPSKYT